jgi:hypothetical protein
MRAGRARSCSPGRIPPLGVLGGGWSWGERRAAVLILDNHDARSTCEPRVDLDGWIDLADEFGRDDATLRCAADCASSENS